MPVKKATPQEKLARAKAPATRKKAVPPAKLSEPVKQPPLTVVGMVASAGGLGAFKEFFQAMPADSGMAFVLIPHLDPKHESLMAPLLSKQTAMPVVEAEEGQRLEANHVYVIPPNHCLTLHEGVIKLSAPPSRGAGETAIDPFLRSLAADQQEQAVCIILSGTGTHGSLGLKAVKAAGGMAMVQEPTTAEYDPMPRSAIDTGLADYVLPPGRMPEELIKYVKHFVAGIANVPKPAAVEADLAQVMTLLRARTQFDFRSYRKRMLLRRVQRRMGLSHLDTLADYLALLREKSEELTQLTRDLLISVTAFFRDPEMFQVLYLDLDDFKAVNDTAGHAAGDLAIRQIASRFKGVVRDRDTLARLGGDEFGLLLENCPAELARERAQQLHRAVEAYALHWKGETYRLGVSIGLTLFKTANHSLNSILASADAACYQAKRSVGDGQHIQEVTLD